MSTLSVLIAHRRLRERAQVRSGSCWTAHSLPSGSLEAGEAAPREVLYLAGFDTAFAEECPGGVSVVDDHLKALERARGALDQAGADGDRARRPGRSQLHEAQFVAHRHVVVDDEADLIGVERLRPLHVRDGNEHQLELEVHHLPLMVCVEPSSRRTWSRDDHISGCPQSHHPFRASSVSESETDDNQFEMTGLRR